MRYQTRQREQILSCLCRNPGIPRSAEGWAAELSRTGTPVGRSTVYRMLRDLEEEGLVRRAANGEGRTVLYEYLEPDSACREHYHLKCTACGSVIHLECGVARELNDHMQQRHGFYVDPGQSILYGLCAQCKKERL